MNPASSEAAAGPAVMHDTQVPDPAKKPDSASAEPAAGAAAGNEPEPPDGPAAWHAEVNAGRIHGAGNVTGTQINNFGIDARLAMPDAWQDDLIEVAPPDSGQGGDCPDIDVHVDALLRSHLLLVRHAPTLGAEAQARAAVRAAVQSLQVRLPGRQAFCSKFDRPFPPQNLCHTARWREDRQNAVIYLFRSDDPASLSFFNANVEPVRDLCRKLKQMNCYLLLSVAMPMGMTLREQGALADLIALWPIDDAQPDAGADLASATGSTFDATLSVCAALFSGLGPDEFVSLVDALLPVAQARTWPAPEAGSGDSPGGTAPVAAAPAPALPRQERWRQGDRDSVLAELGIALQPPPLGNDGAAGLAEPGLFFSDPVVQMAMPSWLYARFPLLLADYVEILTNHYFSTAASPRFCVGYRRLCLRLDAVGARRLTLEWLTRCLRDGLEGEFAQLRAQRFAELLAEISNNGDGQQLTVHAIAAIAALLPEYESGLIAHLRALGVLSDLAARRITPYTAGFWETLSERHDCQAVLERAARRQMIVIDLLQALAAREPSTVAEAMASALQQSTALHAGWLDSARLLRPRLPVQSLARAMFRDRQIHLQQQSADRWLAFAGALAECCAKPVHSASHDGSGADAAAGDTAPTSRRRWLSRDCIVALASTYDETAEAPWPAATHRALIGLEPARHRFAEVLSSLLWANALPAAEDGDFSPARDAVGIDIDTIVWIYHSLAVSVVAHEAGDIDRLSVIVTDLLRPWHRRLRAPQRARFSELARDLLQAKINARDSVDEGTPAKRRAQRSVKAVQVLMRSSRPGRPLAH